MGADGVGHIVEGFGPPAIALVGCHGIEGLLGGLLVSRLARGRMLKALTLAEVIPQQIAQHAGGRTIHGLDKAAVAVGVQLQSGQGHHHLSAALRTGIARVLVLSGQPLQRFIDGGVHRGIAALVVVGCQRLQRHGGHVHVADGFCVGAGAPAAIRILLGQDGLYQPVAVLGIVAAVEGQQAEYQAVDIRVTGIGDLHDIPVLQRRQQVFTAHVGGILTNGGKGQNDTLVVGDGGVMALGIDKNAVRAHILLHIGHDLTVVGLDVCIGQLHAGAGQAQHRPLAAVTGHNGCGHVVLDVLLGVGVHLVKVGDLRAGIHRLIGVHGDILVREKQADSVAVMDKGRIQRGVGQRLLTLGRRDAEHPAGGLAVILLAQCLALCVRNALEIRTAAGIFVLGIVQAGLDGIPGRPVIAGLPGKGVVGPGKAVLVFVIAVHLDGDGDHRVLVGIIFFRQARDPQINADRLLVELLEELVLLLCLLSAVQAEFLPVLGVLGVGQDAVQRNCRIVLRPVHTQELILDDGGSGGSEAAVFLRIEPAGDIVGLDAVEGHIHRAADVFQRAVLVFADLSEGIQVGGDLGLSRILVLDTVPVDIPGQRLGHKGGSVIQFLLCKRLNGEAELLTGQQLAGAAGGDSDHVSGLCRFLTGQRAVDHGVITVEAQHVRGEAHHRDLLVIAVGHDALLLQQIGPGHLQIGIDFAEIGLRRFVHEVHQQRLIVVRQGRLHLVGGVDVKGRYRDVKEHVGVDLHTVLPRDMLLYIRIVVKVGIGHAGDQSFLAGILGQLTLGRPHGADNVAHAGGAVFIAADIQAVGVFRDIHNSPLDPHIVAAGDAVGQRQIGGNAANHGVAIPGAGGVRLRFVGVLAADHLPGQRFGSFRQLCLHIVKAAAHDRAGGDSLLRTAVGDFELQAGVIRLLQLDSAVKELDIAVRGDVLMCRTVKTAGFSAAVRIGNDSLVGHILVAHLLQQAAEGFFNTLAVGVGGVVVEAHPLQRPHRRIARGDHGGDVVQCLLLLRRFGPQAEGKGLDLALAAGGQRGLEGDSSLAAGRRGERAGGGVHQSVIRRPSEGNGLLSTALRGNGDARGQGQEAGIGLRGLLFLLRVAAHRGKAAELIDAGGIGLQKVCILGIEPQFLIEVLLQGGQEVVVQVRDRFAGLFDAVLLTEVGLIVIVLKVIESQHILGVPVGLGFLGGVGGAHAPQGQALLGLADGPQVVGGEHRAALPGQNGETAVEGTVILIHAHVHGELRGAHIVRGMGGHAAGGTIRRGLWCDGVQISAVGDGGAGVHLAYHRTELTLICYCELSCHIGTLELCISVQFAYKAAAFLIDNLIRLRLFYRESTGKIAVLDNTVCISGNASQRCGCTICTIIVSILDDSPTNATTNHTVAGIPSSNAADCRCTIISPAGERDTTTDHAVPYRSCTGIGNTSQKRRSTDNRAIHTQIFNYAALCKFPHKAGCNESTNGVIIAVQGAGELIATGADGRPGLAVEVDVGGEFGADISLPVLDGIGKPGQLRGGIDQVDTALVLRGRGLGRAVPSLTGIGQCYRDGVVFGSGKAAADRDIVRLGDGIGIRLAGVDDVCAVLVCCDRAAHGVGHGHRGVRRSYGKGQGTGGKFAQRDGLVHIGANGDVPRLGLVAELADGVGIGTGGNGVCAVFAGDLRAATVLQHHRCTVGSVKGEGVGCGGGKILEPDIVTAATFAERQGEFFILIQHRAKGFPTVLLVGCQQSSTLFHGKGRIVFP